MLMHFLTVRGLRWCVFTGPRGIILSDLIVASLDLQLCLSQTPANVLHLATNLVLIKGGDRFLRAENVRVKSLVWF